MIIFGAGVIGGIILDSCLDDCKEVTAFCDNLATGKYRGLPIIKPSDITSKDEVIIATSYIGDVVNQLNSLGIDKWYYGYGLISAKKRDAYTQYLVDTFRWCQRNHSNPSNPSAVRSLDVVITEKCTLRCRDCSNLIPKIQAPHTYNTWDIMEQVKALDFIPYEYRIIGGEPLLNRQWYSLANNLSYLSCEKVVIYTNATIMPNDLDKLKKEKVLFFITDYGKLSKAKDKLIEELKKLGIDYYCSPASGWTNCGQILSVERENSRDIYSKCCARNLTTLSDGKIFPCPFSASLFRIKGISGEVGGVPRACGFCNGRSLGDKIIVPAIQEDK